MIPARRLALATVSPLQRQLATAATVATAVSARHFGSRSHRLDQKPSWKNDPNPMGFQPFFMEQKSSLPMNTVVRFVPQQTAWIVERMGKFNRILKPGLAILVPFLDRIAYVKSLKEVAIEIPSQSAITADNVTLELDGVLYIRVFDAYKARYGFFLFLFFGCLNLDSLQLKMIGFGLILINFLFFLLVTESKTPSMPSRSWPRRRCGPRSASSRSTTS